MTQDNDEDLDYEPTLTLNDLALALAGVMHGQSWWQKQPKSRHRDKELAKYVELNTKLSKILNYFEMPRNDEGEIPDNGDKELFLIDPDEAESLEEFMESLGDEPDEKPIPEINIPEAIKNYDLSTPIDLMGRRKKPKPS